jgi:hypothetical protein
MSAQSMRALAVRSKHSATTKPNEASVRATFEVATHIAGALAIGAAVIALVVQVALASAVRRWLAYPFTRIPARAGEAATIFLHNVRALAAVGGMLLIAQTPYWAGKDHRGLVHRAILPGCEALLAASVSANVIVIGASLGAYDERMVRATLPHGPVELGAYALALALYIQGRDKALPARHSLAISALSISLLALAAVLETFVNV